MSCTCTLIVFIYIQCSVYTTVHTCISSVVVVTSKWVGLKRFLGFTVSACGSFPTYSSDGFEPVARHSVVTLSFMLPQASTQL